MWIISKQKYEVTEIYLYVNVSKWACLIQKRLVETWDWETQSRTWAEDEREILSKISEDHGGEQHQCRIQVGVDRDTTDQRW